jgi:hypothetical protein
MAEVVVILFALLRPADGSQPQLANVAQVVTTDVCQTIAAELNASPRKPPELTFGCRVVRAGAVERS